MSPDARVVTLGKARRTLDAASRAVARCPEWAAQVRKNWSQHPNVRGAPMSPVIVTTLPTRCCGTCFHMVGNKCTKPLPRLPQWTVPMGGRFVPEEYGTECPTWEERP